MKPKNKHHVKASNIKPSKGKKITGKGRGKAAKTVRHRLSNIRTKTSGKTDKRIKPNKKVVSKSSIQVQRKQNRKGIKGKTVAKKSSNKIRPDSLRIAKHERGKQVIEITFKGIRKIDKKIESFETSEKLNKSIKEQLKRKSGKPPKGIIIVVRDKKGREAAHVSRPSFVGNEKNIKNEIEKFTKELKKDYSKFAQRLSDQGMTTDQWESTQLGGGGSEDIGYEDYNPDSIQEIDIKFIY